MATYVFIYMVIRPVAPVYVLGSSAVAIASLVNIITCFAVMAVIAYYYSLAADMAEAAIGDEHQKSEALLHNILPTPVALRLKEDASGLSDGHEEATILFADIVGFTPLSERVTPQELTEMLNDVFSLFDDLVDELGLEKIKTIGDAYMAAGGVPEARADHADAVCDLALRMMAAMESHRLPGGEKLQMRMGINSGPVVAGVIGKKRFIYDLWGDTVNLAARMESHGLPGRIQITEATRSRLSGAYRCEERGEVEIKGKGKTRAYWLSS